MTLDVLFRELSMICDASRAIEALARRTLLTHADAARTLSVHSKRLPKGFDKVLQAPDAHPVCTQIKSCDLPWSVPETSDDPLYRAHSQTKRSVELIGPSGLIRSSELRLGLYGILPRSDYGFRTHPAEEVFIMLAGRADWAKGDDGYKTLGPGARAFHPSGMRHATRTRDHAFMSLYIWRGDLSFDAYVYAGRGDP